ncbi:MAG TPA: hypothetical protein PLN06_10500 [Bacteroidales bacterium]|nr:hypothetical protein [Bacteroidales bacterium]
MNRYLIPFAFLTLFLIDSCKKDDIVNEKQIPLKTEFRPVEISYNTGEWEDEKAAFIYDSKKLIRKEWYDIAEVDYLISKTEFDYSQWGNKIIDSQELWLRSSIWELDIKVSYVFKDDLLTQIKSADNTATISFFYSNDKLVKVETIGNEDGHEISYLINITYQDGLKKTSTFFLNGNKQFEINYHYSEGKIGSFTRKYFINNVFDASKSETLNYEYAGMNISKVTMIEYNALSSKVSEIFFTYDDNGNLSRETWISKGKTIWDFIYKFEKGESNSLFLIDYGEKYMDHLLFDFPLFTTNYFFDYRYW